MGLAIRLRSAVALLGRFPALAGVDLDVAAGEIVLLQGPNGAGKTSLLRACAGLLPIVDGVAEVLGHDLRVDRRSVRRSVGLLGHATFLYDDLSVIDNIRFAVKASRADTDRVPEAMGVLGLDGRLRRVPVNRLSAGQRRRVALAVILARAPELWLLDEPHAGLDTDSRDVLDAIVRDAAAGGATVVLASHEHERASALAGRAVTIAGGRIVDDSRPLTVAPAAEPAVTAPGEPPAMMPERSKRFARPRMAAHPGVTMFGRRGAEPASRVGGSHERAAGRGERINVAEVAHVA